MNDLNILFYVKKTKKNRAGEAPIYLRITVNGQRVEMSVGRGVRPFDWDSRSQRIKGKSEKNRLINNYIDELENKINRIYNIALQEKQQISAEYLKDAVSGKDKMKKMLIPVFEEYYKLLKREEGTKYATKTVARYKHALTHLKSFLEKEYHVTDMDISKLDLKFLKRFDIYLQTEANYHHNTVTKYLKILKTVINSALSFGYLDRNPFHGYSTTYKAGTRQFLNAAEVKLIEEAIMPNERLERVRDVFIFICYTGISYADLSGLSMENLSKGIDGKTWLAYHRIKTKVRASMPLLKPAISMVEKYKEDILCNAEGKILPIISNQKFNNYLKEIATVCKITKTLSAHIGRHTFATTVTLTNEVPIESVSKMLGHTSLKTTQLYAKVVDTKISNDMHKLEQNLAKQKIS